MIISGCCVTLDNILSYIFKQKSELNSSCLENYQLPLFSYPAQATFPTKKLRQVTDPESNMFLEVTERHPEILQRILSTLLNVVMFEDCKNQWSMSRPLFVLILLYEDYFRYFSYIHLALVLLMTQTADNYVTISSEFSPLKNSNK